MTGDGEGCKSGEGMQGSGEGVQEDDCFWVQGVGEGRVHGGRGREGVQGVGRGGGWCRRMTVADSIALLRSGLY